MKSVTGGAKAVCEKWSQRWESNPQHPLYESGALPLSHSGPQPYPGKSIAGAFLARNGIATIRHDDAMDDQTRQSAIVYRHFVSAFIASASSLRAAP